MLAIKELFTSSDTGQKYKVINLFAKKGTNILKKKKLCEVEAENGDRLVVKAQNSGVVSRVLVQQDDIVQDGSEIMEITACTHPALMGSICCDCGMVLDDKDISKTESVSMLHSVPDLKIAKAEAEKLGQKDITNLLSLQKLVLLVDLDQTLIHTTNDNIPPELKDVYHFQLHPAGPWYHTRLRPHTKEFLEKMSKLFELHICTFGVREYAHYIAHFLDPEAKLFSQRILSRNECLDPMSKKANLNSLFPCGDNLVCIIDDRTDVWNFSPNVVQVVPYHFFRHTGDINAPQGLQKRENDDRQGIDFKTFGKDSTKDTLSGDGADASDEEFDKRSYSSDSDSDKDSKKDRQDVDTGKVSDDSAVDVNTDDERRDLKEDDGKDLKKVNEVNSEKLSGEEDEKASKKEYKSSKDKQPDRDKDEEKVKENAGKDEDIQDVDEVANSDRVHNKPLTNNNEKESNVKVEENLDGEKSKEKKTKAKNDVGSEKETQNGEEKKTGALQSNEETKKDNLIEVNDDDDFLLYLEDILVKIHQTFFQEYEKAGSHSSTMPAKGDSLPDLKSLVPKVRKDVLKRVNIVFSGVVPQQVKLRDSKAYQIATCFGASVSERLVIKAKGDADRNSKTPYTTHLVAANLSTEKVHRARRCKSIKIVTPNWLWSCVERWEVVEERLFPLTKETEKDIQRHPPHHCYCPNSPIIHPPQVDEIPGPSSRMRTPSGTLLEGVNPLLFFSPDDKNSMTSEVDMLLSDEGGDNNDTSTYDNSESESDEDDDDDDDSEPSRKKHRGLDVKNIDNQSSSSSDRQSEDDDEDDDDLPSKVFREGGGLPSDDSDEGVTDEDDLSRMGADLESLLN
ncbi:RNA polymerase II [Halocaridina rubra]|uniref:RNA polymerase II subunit A C-terminal domain phosphatase n=1 Tax=Halocaridina rubra TaxID=373956 RepID=A0AAN8XQQ7_HALRR